MSDYQTFLAAKVAVAPVNGFVVQAEEINPILKPHQRDIVIWACRLGRAAIFASFGLGKTLIALEILRLIHEREGGDVLIVCPLGVRQEFRRDAAMIGLETRFIKRDAERNSDHWLYVTNYESVRDGKIDPRKFAATSLDEAAVLRGFGGTATFRKLMGLFEGSGKYRFVATATPSPNEYIELLAYAGFLDVIDVGLGKTRWFKRDSTQADHLTIHPHKEAEFWLWVATWALFVNKPSDLGHSDEGYALPPIEVHWHEVASDHSAAGAERDGQGRMFRNAAHGVSEAAAEKRDSLDTRVDKLMDIVARADGQWVVWCDLNAEQRAIESALSAVATSYSSLYGSQSEDDRETLLEEWRSRQTAAFISKPSMYGAGVNLQQCHNMAFVGVGFKFYQFAQAIHRIHRFLQESACDIHIIYTEAEREIKRSLQAKWSRHEELVDRMSAIVREYGLTEAALSAAMARSIGCERREASGENWIMVNNDCVDETQRMEANSVGLIVTSIPFATQYEYTPSYNDFGHTDSNAHFWEQMGFLSPELLRILQPGRVMAIHVKDRIIPGGLTGLGFQTLNPFHAEAIFHYQQHGFAFIGMKTITTDVVRENNQTYRLGWTEQCKDGTRMGVGVPEYLLLFRKPPTDLSNGYADVPVEKMKPLADDHGEPRPFDKRTNWKQPVPGTGYSRAKWQLDAHAYAKSSGDRLLSSEELLNLPHEQLFKLWRERSKATRHDHAEHVRVCEEMDHAQRLPATFMLFPPHSTHPDVWTDITRMRTLNGAQYAAGREMHLCPLQFEIVDRAIEQFTMQGETVFDPFAGLGSVPYCAVKLGRKGIGVELNAGYWADGVFYCDKAEKEAAVPTLFDLLDMPALEAAE